MNILPEERSLFARIELGRIVRHPEEGWQLRYCEAIRPIARHFEITQKELAAAFMDYYGPSLLFEKPSSSANEIEWVDSELIQGAVKSLKSVLESWKTACIDMKGNPNVEFLAEFELAFNEWLRKNRKS